MPYLLEEAESSGKELFVCNFTLLMSKKQSNLKIKDLVKVTKSLFLNLKLIMGWDLLRHKVQCVLFGTFLLQL